MKHSTVNLPERFGRKGNMIVEFALVFPFLTILLTGSFTVGMALNRSIQCRNVCRNSNVLLARNVDLSKTENQQLLIRTAAGLGFNIPGTQTADPNGKGAIYLTKVVKVGPVACATGINNWDGNASTCPNHNQYVITQRIKLCNTTRWSSAAGNPSTTPDSEGKIDDVNIAVNQGNRATGFKATQGGAGIIFLDLDGFTFLSEVFADVSELNLLPTLSAPMISVRNVS